MLNFNVSFSIEEFCQLDVDSFKGRLTEKHQNNHRDLVSKQLGVWKTEYNDLKEILKDKVGRIIFEYDIPGLPKTIDVVLLIKGTIFVIEYKDNTVSTFYSQQDISQVNGYALRLKYFHSQSNDNWIVPILVVTNANEEQLLIERSEDDMVYKPLLCNSNNLKNAIEAVLSQTEDIKDIDRENNWEKDWENGVYKASPTIIEAARLVWRNNNVPGFKTAEADEETRLAAEDYIVNTVVPDAERRNHKAIVFVTGVPGAGKTLVGLNISVKLQEKGASLLSGNKPLVTVLTAALKRDLSKYKKQAKNTKDEISVESIIRGAYGYKKEIFEKRLDYHVGEGKVTLRENCEKGSQHIVIFDEAQRAWNREKMIRPGQSGRKYWQEDKFPFSEPALLLWDMDQMDWGVFVCLVGGGQEIHDGEAGITEWLRSLEKLNDWDVYISDKLQMDVYNAVRGTDKTIEDYCNKLKEEGRLIVDNSLYLTANQRSSRSEKVSDFVEELLKCNTDKSRELYKDIKNKFHIYLTRDIDVARKKLYQRSQEIRDKGYVDGQNDENVRYGILMSSRALRIRPLGYEIRKVSDYLNKVPSWFLDSSDYVNSSNYMEIALNEFFVQGLELDLTALIWDADFRYDKEKNQWTYYEFNGRNWRAVVKKDQKLKRTYMKNAYRVLLTRARVGMVIVVPHGDENDKTRSFDFYDSTYEYLKSIGLEEI